MDRDRQKKIELVGEKKEIYCRGVCVFVCVYSILPNSYCRSTIIKLCRFMVCVFDKYSCLTLHHCVCVCVCVCGGGGD